MGAWLFELPSAPCGVLCPTSLGQGGPSGRVLGMCTPRGAMRWSAAGLCRLYPLSGPHVPTPGSMSVWRAAPRHGIDIPASQGAAPPGGHGDGDCAVDRGSSRILLFVAMVRRASGPRVHGMVCAVLHSFLGVPGLQVVRSPYEPGALDVSGAPRDPSAYIIGLGESRRLTGTDHS